MNDSEDIKKKIAAMSKGNSVAVFGAGVSGMAAKKLLDKLGIESDIYADRQVRMMIENANHEVVGIIDLINFDPKHMRAEIGIVIERKHRNKGLAQSAINKIKEYSLDILHLHQLYAYINVDNKQSLNLFERCGFLPSNELKDWLFDGKNYHNALLMQLFL